MKIILGSQSKGRRGVLVGMGLDFEMMSADIDEKAIRLDDPRQLTLALAHAKADTLLPKITKDAILITADQVVVCNGQIFEKPTNEKEVREFVRSYAKHPAETVTAVVVVNTATKARCGGVDVAKVWFRSIPESVINEVIKSGDIYFCAGGFSVEDPKLKPYVDRIEGAKDSVIGLPTELTWRLMGEVGWSA